MIKLIERKNELFDSIKIKWSVDFDCSLDGQSIDFVDLDDYSIEYILDCLSKELTTGELCVPLNNDDVYGKWYARFTIDENGYVAYFKDLPKQAQEHIIQYIKNGRMTGIFYLRKEDYKEVSLYIFDYNDTNDFDYNWIISE